MRGVVTVMQKFDLQWVVDNDFYVEKHDKGSNVWLFKEAFSINTFVVVLERNRTAKYAWHIHYSQGANNAMLYFSGSLKILKVVTRDAAYIHQRYTKRWQELFAPIIRQICCEYPADVQMEGE